MQDLSIIVPHFNTILILVLASIGLRYLLVAMGQRWVTTYAHTATLVLLPVVTFVITKVISGNIALSLGMVGALSIVRFRNPVRSPLELSAYFAAITMGIAASVHVVWLVFLICSIVIALMLLRAVAVAGEAISKQPYFSASFNEGNSLSTLEVETKSAVSQLDDSAMLKSKTRANDGFSYLLVANDGNALKAVLTEIEADKNVTRYQLNV